MPLFRQKFVERMDIDPATEALPTASTQSTVASVCHFAPEDGTTFVSPAQWRTYQTAHGICWICGDQLPTGARFCIACGVETGTATGETERL